MLLCLLRLVVPFRLVVTIHARQAQWSKGFARIFRKFIFAADHLIADSRRIGVELREIGVPESRITVIPLGTMRLPERDPVVTADIRAELGIPHELPILLNIARMAPGKGQQHLVRAMASVDAAAVIVGDGPEEAALRDLVASLGLQQRVFFTGRRTDLHNFYSAARAFVMPCLDESMGIVIYDALVYRLPVIAYDSGSIAEVIDDGVNGWLLPPDPAALAAALNRLLREAPAFAFLPAEEYSATRMADRHNALYQSLASEWKIEAA